MREERTRAILHIDLDAFYASIEQRDYSQYRGKPTIVGGSPDRRGVVATRPPVQRGQRLPQRIGQDRQVPARRPDRPTSAAMPAGDTSTCPTKGTGLSTSTERSSTSTAARPDSGRP